MHTPIVVVVVVEVKDVPRHVGHDAQNHWLHASSQVNPEVPHNEGQHFAVVVVLVAWVEEILVLVVVCSLVLVV